jgi:hypothetical protein
VKGQLLRLPPLLFAITLGGLTLVGCGHAKAPLESEVLLEASEAQRPAWITANQRSTDETLVWMGRAGGSTTEGAFRRAERDAISELVSFYYGPIIDRAFGIDPEDTSPFLEDRDSNTSRETRNRVIERVIASGTEDATRAKVLERYWERYRMPTDDGEGREMIQTYTIVQLRRAAVDDVVANLLGQSPTLIAIAGMEREAAFLVAEAKRQVRGGLEAGRANQVPVLVKARRRTGELMADLDRVAGRYERVAKTPLKVGTDEAKSGAESLERLALGVLRSLRAGASVSVYRGVRSRIPGLVRLMLESMASLQIPVADPGATKCAQGLTHWIHATFDPPDCVHPDEGYVCDLGLTVDLWECPAVEAVDQYVVEGAALRGRGSAERAAVLAAWKGLESHRKDALRRELDVLLSRHLPTRVRVNP